MAEQNSVPQPTKPHGDQIHWNTKHSKQNLVEEPAFFKREEEHK